MMMIAYAFALWAAILFCIFCPGHLLVGLGFLQVLLGLGFAGSSESLQLFFLLSGCWVLELGCCKMYLKTNRQQHMDDSKASEEVKEKDGSEKVKEKDGSEKENVEAATTSTTSICQKCLLCFGRGEVVIAIGFFLLSFGLKEYHLATQNSTDPSIAYGYIGGSVAWFALGICIFHKKNGTHRQVAVDTKQVDPESAEKEVDTEVSTQAPLHKRRSAADFILVISCLFIFSGAVMALLALHHINAGRGPNTKTNHQNSILPDAKDTDSEFGIWYAGALALELLLCVSIRHGCGNDQYAIVEDLDPQDGDGDKDNSESSKTNETTAKTCLQFACSGEMFVYLGVIHVTVALVVLNLVKKGPEVVTAILPWILGAVFWLLLGVFKIRFFEASKSNLKKESLKSAEGKNLKSIETTFHFDHDPEQMTVCEEDATDSSTETEKECLEAEI